MDVIVRAVGLGLLVLLVGTIPRNLAFVANLRYHADVPWAVPLVALYVWLFWRYAGGWGPPESTRALRRLGLRANPVAGRVWAWALVTGGLGVVALIVGLRIGNRLLVLPEQDASLLANVPTVTAWSLLLMSAPVAGFIEEGAFRGYMQGPIERRYGLPVAILVTGTMFAVAHLDFTPILWPYYVAVAAIYGAVTSQANSVWPAVILHTAGNLYSNVDLLLHGRAEWQAPATAATLVWTTGVDAAFVQASVALVVLVVAVWRAHSRLARVAREEHDVAGASGAV